MCYIHKINLINERFLKGNKVAAVFTMKFVNFLEQLSVKISST
jgi:hypothetical protein